MDEAKRTSTGVRRWRLAVWGGAAALLLAPALAMQVTDEMNWGLGDFIFAGVVLTGVCVAFELAARTSGSVAYRLGAGLALATGLLLLWINLAVGVIGSEDNPANAVFGIVLGVAVLGSVLARFRPAGLALAMCATAAVQVLVAVAVQVAGWGFVWPVTIGLGAFWLASAWLFHRAARGPSGRLAQT